jgi:glutathione S-transferase
MYTLYYLPGACSLATQVVLRELGQSVEIIDKQQVVKFSDINPAGMVPVLIDNKKTVIEGAAVMLYLLNKHPNSMFPTVGDTREQAIQDIMFANATMHPAYGRLFFITQNIDDQKAKQASFDAAAKAITGLWQLVEQKLVEQPFLGGEHPSAADIMLAVYSRWGSSFPVDISFGPRTQAMLDTVIAMPSFIQSITAEKLQSAA